MTKEEKVDLYIRKLAEARHVDYNTAKEYAIVQSYKEYIHKNVEITAD